MSERNACKGRKPKVRNYSFSESKRLPANRMTEVNGVKIPALPGSCYHAIISALAEHKNAFLVWDRITESVERYMRQYGGQSAWEKFKSKEGVKTYQQRIRDNTHTLTRTGRDCYGYRLHEMGMAIYFFKDGAMLLTDGRFEKSGSYYEVQFSDGRGLQVRYRGTTMTNKEYKRFLEAGLITSSARILNPVGIRKLRKESIVSSNGRIPSLSHSQLMSVCVTLHEGFNQDTATRLERLGLEVEQAIGNVLTGQITSDKLGDLETDEDVLGVEIANQKTFVRT
jgi:hypothetical protein